MANDQMEMLEELMALEFTLIDLHLYLDTHPGDTRALAENRTLALQMRMLKNRYEQRFGPLTPESGAGAAWIEEPWPWQLNFAEED